MTSMLKALRKLNQSAPLASAQDEGATEADVVASVEQIESDLAEVAAEPEGSDEYGDSIANIESEAAIYADQFHGESSLIGVQAASEEGVATEQSQLADSDPIYPEPDDVVADEVSTPSPVDSFDDRYPAVEPGTDAAETDSDVIWQTPPTDAVIAASTPSDPFTPDPEVDEDWARDRMSVVDLDALDPSPRHSENVTDQVDEPDADAPYFDGESTEISADTAESGEIVEDTPPSEIEESVSRETELAAMASDDAAEQEVLTDESDADCEVAEQPAADAAQSENAFEDKDHNETPADPMDRLLSLVDELTSSPGGTPAIQGQSNGEEWSETVGELDSAPPQEPATPEEAHADGVDAVAESSEVESQELSPPSPARSGEATEATGAEQPIDDSLEDEIRCPDEDEVSQPSSSDVELSHESDYAPPVDEPSPSYQSFPTEAESGEISDQHEDINTTSPTVLASLFPGGSDNTDSPPLDPSLVETATPPADVPEAPVERTVMLDEAQLPGESEEPAGVNLFAAARDSNDETAATADVPNEDPSGTGDSIMNMFDAGGGEDLLHKALMDSVEASEPPAGGGFDIFSPVASTELVSGDEESASQVASETESSAVSENAEPAPAVELSPAEITAAKELTTEPLGEQFRQLAEHLILAHATRGKAVLFLDAEPTSEVSDALLRIAMILATQSGTQVLLVDTKSGRESLTWKLGLSEKSGLGEVLQGQQAWQDVVHAAATPNVCLVPRGVSELPELRTDDERLKPLFSEVARQWDLVLVDGGDVGSANFDSLATTTGGAYLVAQAGGTATSAAKSAAARLAACSFDFCGCILTNASAE